MKGKVGCESRHIDDGDLSRRLLVRLMPWLIIRITSRKWEGLIAGEDILIKVIAKRFIGAFKTAKSTKQFDVDLYFKLTEKITIYDGKLVVSLLDGSEVTCEIE